MVVVNVTAAARVVVVISSNLFECMFCGGIFGVGSGRGFNSCGGSTNKKFLLQNCPTLSDFGQFFLCGHHS